MTDFKQFIRNNILDLRPYSSARHEFQGTARIFLDANENPFESKWNRYPDPFQHEVKEHLAQFRKVRPDQIVLGNGSDEIIDLAIRIFCQPGVDNMIICPPTYGMYQVYADINEVHTRKAPLSADFELNAHSVLEQIDEHTKIIFLCSPNNPTGNLMQEDEVKTLLNNAKAMVVIDEAYIDFADQESWTFHLQDYPNLIVMQTFSKAFGLAGIRLGIGIMHSDLATVFNAVKAPYNVNSMTQEIALQRLQDMDAYYHQVEAILTERERMLIALEKLELIERIYTSQANFLLVKTTRNAKGIYNELRENSVIVRDRSAVLHCNECLRFTIGTREENDELLEKLQWITQ